MIPLRRILRKTFHQTGIYSTSSLYSQSFSSLSNDDKKHENKTTSFGHGLLQRTKSLAPGIVSSTAVATLGFMSADQLGSILLSAQGTS